MKRSIATRSWRTILDAAAALSMTCASVALLWAIVMAPPTGRGNVPSTRPHGALRMPEEPLSTTGAPILGDVRAPIAVIEFADFQCPSCVKFAREVLPAVVERLIRPGKVQLVFRQLPLEALHPTSFAAAKLAECGKREGKFWAAHDLLFAGPFNGTEPDVVRSAAALGVDDARFQACLRVDAEREVRAEIAEARRLGVSGTPTFLFGRPQPGGRLVGLRWYRGVPSFDAFEKVVTHLLNQASPL